MNCVLEGLPVKFGTFLKKKKTIKKKEGISLVCLPMARSRFKGLPDFHE